MPSSDTYFLKVRAHVYLKQATDNCFRDKKIMKV